MFKCLLNLVTLDYTHVWLFWNDYWFWFKNWHCKLILRNLQRFDLVICLGQRPHSFKCRVLLSFFLRFKAEMSTWVMRTFFKTSFSALFNSDLLEETIPEILFFLFYNLIFLLSEHSFFIHFLLFLELLVNVRFNFAQNSCF